MPSNLPHADMRVYRVKTHHDTFLCRHDSVMVHTTDMNADLCYLCYTQGSSYGLLLPKSTYMRIEEGGGDVQPFSLFQWCMVLPAHILRVGIRGDRYTLLDIQTYWFCSVRPMSGDAQGEVQGWRVEPNSWEKFTIEDLGQSPVWAQDILQWWEEYQQHPMGVRNLPRGNQVELKIAYALRMAYMRYADLCAFTKKMLEEKDFGTHVTTLFSDDWYINFSYKNFYEKYHRHVVNTEALDTTSDILSHGYNKNFYQTAGHRCCVALREHFHPMKTSCLVATACNEGLYLTEFILYYKLMGFDKIILYSNNNTDGSDTLLDAMMQHGYITHINNNLHQGSPQKKAYTHASLLNTDVLDYKYVFFCDIDEFLVLNNNIFDNVNDFCHFHEQHGSNQIFVNWVWVGSCGQNKYSNGFVLERFPVYNCIVDSTCKTFVRPKDILSPFCHFAYCNPEKSIRWNESDGKQHTYEIAKNKKSIKSEASSDYPTISHAYCLHFWSKSLDEYILRLTRIRGDQEIHSKTEMFKRHNDILYQRFINNFRHTQTSLTRHISLEMVTALRKSYAQLPDEIKKIDNDIKDYYDARIPQLRALFIENFSKSTNPYEKRLTQLCGLDSNDNTFEKLQRYNPFERKNMKFYIKKYSEIYKKLYNENYISHEALHCEEYKNVILLPPKVYRTIGAHTNYAGGVCYEDGTFITGFMRDEKNNNSNMQIHTSYTIRKEDISECLEYGIYGGVIINNFGHTIVETISRLWFLSTQLNITKKIIFIKIGKTVPEYFFSVMKLLNIKQEMIKIIEKPIKVETLLIPDQSFIIFSKVYPEYYNKIYEIMKKNAKGKAIYEKIYLSRRKFAKHDIIGEDIIEDILQKNGFQSLALEEFSLSEQIYMLSHARDIVSTVGTLSHMAALFCKEGAKVTYLLRENEPGAIKPQIILDKINITEISIIDTTFNFLPTTHANGIYLFIPNENFKKWLDDNGYIYNIFRIDKYSKYILDYINTYTEHYSKYGYGFKRVELLDFFDVIERMSSVLLGKTLYRNDFHTISKNTLQNQISGIEQNLSGDLARFINFSTISYDKKNICAADEIIDIFSDDNTIHILKDKHLLQDAIHKIMKNIHIHLAWRQILQILYVGICVKYTKYKYIKFNYLNSGIHFDADLFSKMSYKDIDCLFPIIRISTPIDIQYMKCYGQSSWDIIKKHLASDIFVDAITCSSGHNLRYVFCKNVFCMKTSVFSKFFDWYVDMIQKIGHDIPDDGQWLIDKISERLISLYFYSYSFKDLHISYIG